MYKSETLASASQYYIYRQRSYIAFTLRQKHKTMANLFKKSVSSVVITVFHGVICKIYTGNGIDLPLSAIVRLMGDF
jgi:hypothetical protein